ncbi:MAG: cobyrinate a,c-diamide synthase [Gammaproteobacteria bacterium]|nr:cobyrinate a,c-diamide synthase [Gammaproteobacteria bacterium]
MQPLLVSAAHKSSGKTTLSIGLAAALRARGTRVQTFKKGPDYIDPLWLALASGQPCYNLDHWTQSEDEIRALFSSQGTECEVALVEGNKGLFDGLSMDGHDSSAGLAQCLDIPVLLVIDCLGITRGVAPLLRGYVDFEPGVRIAGVILNRVASERHLGKLRAAVETYTDIPVLGWLPRDERLVITERHLGLVPANEASDASERIALLADSVTQHIDLDALLACLPHRTAPPAAAPAPGIETTQRIGVLRDAAFGFYYADDLDALRAAGAELVMLDALSDTRLPAVDGLFIGGGFPETHMQALSANSDLRAAIRTAAQAGLPVFAECGGLMYLSRAIRWRGQRHEMVGLVPAETIMQERPVGRGYTRLRVSAAHPWPDHPAGLEIRGHEFHYSCLEGLPADTRFAYSVERGHGLDGQNDGIVIGNTLASYSHRRNVASAPWVRGFLSHTTTHARERSVS